MPSVRVRVGGEEEGSGTRHIWSSSVVTFVPSTSL